MAPDTGESEHDADRYLREELPSLLELIQNSDLREIQIQDGDVTVRLHRAALPPGEQVAGPVEEFEPIGTLDRFSRQVVAPLVGTFYRADAPGKPPLVSEGARVDDETVVGIIEALQVLTPVEAGCTGTVTRVLATDGQPVEYGQLLLEVEVDD